MTQFVRKRRPCLVCSLNIEEIFHLTYDRVNGGEPLVVKLSIFHSPARPDRRGEGVFALAWLVSWHLVRLLQLFPSNTLFFYFTLTQTVRIRYWWSRGHLVSCWPTNTFLGYLVDKDKCVVFAVSHMQGAESAKHGTITNRFRDLHHRQIYITKVGPIIFSSGRHFLGWQIVVLAKTNYRSFPC